MLINREAGNNRISDDYDFTADVTILYNDTGIITIIVIIAR